VLIYSPAGVPLGRITAPVNPRNIAFGDAGQLAPGMPFPVGFPGT
jgi:hypothetical protein